MSVEATVRRIPRPSRFPASTGLALPKREVGLPRSEIAGADLARPGALRDVPHLQEARRGPSFRLDVTSRQSDWEDGMSWKTPKIVELPVGMEINMYACAARK
jgi:coenzyme PQQ precursor peptide PqqA